MYASGGCILTHLKQQQTLVRGPIVAADSAIVHFDDWVEAGWEGRAGQGRAVQKQGGAKQSRAGHSRAGWAGKHGRY